MQSRSKVYDKGFRRVQRDDQPNLRVETGDSAARRRPQGEISSLRHLHF